jgi:hypothetical protein
MFNNVLRSLIVIACLGTVATPYALYAQVSFPCPEGQTDLITGLPFLPPVLPPTRNNSLGWSTGYSAITTISERPNPLGQAFGGSDTVHESVTRIVPNDLLGNPVRYGSIFESQPNSAGWNTGYSLVTSTYERPEPFAGAFGRDRTVTESTTRILPNDALGQPIRPFGGLFP